MAPSKALTLLASAALITGASAALSDEPAKPSASPSEIVNLKEALSEILVLADKNLEQPWVRSQYLYDGYRVAFQLGKFHEAKQLLTDAALLGVSLNYWDIVSLAEISARDNDYDTAKTFMTTAISTVKKHRCRYDKTWKKFNTALQKNDLASVENILANAGTPALLQTQPTQEAQITYPADKAKIKRNYVYFYSDNPARPEHLNVNLVVDARGNIRCTTIDARAVHGEMLQALGPVRYRPAAAQNRKVWQYGIPFEIRKAPAQTFRGESNQSRSAIDPNPAPIGT